MSLICYRRELRNLSNKANVWIVKKGNQNNRNFECVIGLLSVNISKDKIDQVILAALGKLAKKDMERLQSAGVTARLIQKVSLPRAKNI